MPTAAKLISAILLGVLGYIVADRVGAQLPEATRQGMLRPVSAAWGVVLGWRFLGPRANVSLGNAVAIGVSAALLHLICAMFTFAFFEMIRRALRKAYGGNPVEALEDMFQIAVGYLEYLAFTDVLGPLVGGAAVVGLVASFAARRWS